MNLFGIVIFLFMVFLMAGTSQSVESNKEAAQLRIEAQKQENQRRKESQIKTTQQKQCEFYRNNYELTGKRMLEGLERLDKLKVLPGVTDADLQAFKELKRKSYQQHLADAVYLEMHCK